jgi:hypothetical protein
MIVKMWLSRCGWEHLSRPGVADVRRTHEGDALFGQVRIDGKEQTLIHLRAVTRRGGTARRRAVNPTCLSTDREVSFSDSRVDPGRCPAGLREGRRNRRAGASLVMRPIVATNGRDEDDRRGHQGRHRARHRRVEQHGVQHRHTRPSGRESPTLFLDDRHRGVVAVGDVHTVIHRIDRDEA